MLMTGAIRHIGVDDHGIDLFEGQYEMPDGMAYNAYAILNEKTAVVDSADGRFAEEWLGNIREALSGRTQMDALAEEMANGRLERRKRGSSFGIYDAER